MKKLLFFITLIMTIVQPIFTKNDKTTILGTIKFPSKIDNIPNIPIYYKGKKIETDIGNFSLKESNFSEIYLIITEEIDPKMSQVIRNEVPYKQLALFTSGKKPYKYYLLKLRNKYLTNLEQQLKLDRTKKQESYPFWDIKELTIDRNEIELPLNTIIILYNPKYIEKIEEKKWSGSQKTLKLPNIIIKNIDELKLLEAANKAIISSLDLDSIHSKSTKRELKKKLVRISMRD